MSPATGTTAPGENMGYKRSVHCSYCHQRGHNKSGCPEWKAKIESLRASYGDDHYRVARYDAKKASRAASVSKRKCSYCGEQGHNRAGCSKLKAAMESFRGRNVEYRQNVLNALIENGIGPGAMVKITQRWSGSVHIYMLTEISWGDIDMTDKNRDFIEMKRVQSLMDKHGGHGCTRLPVTVTGISWGPSWEIVVPSNEARIRETMPATYLAGTLGLKRVFKDKNSSIYTMKDSWGDYDREFDVSNYTTSLM
jgi:hypothetical protein